MVNWVSSTEVDGWTEKVWKTMGLRDEKVLKLTGKNHKERERERELAEERRLMGWKRSWPVPFFLFNFSLFLIFIPFFFSFCSTSLSNEWRHSFLASGCLLLLLDRSTPFYLWPHRQLGSRRDTRPVYIPMDVPDLQEDSRKPSTPVGSCATSQFNPKSYLIYWISV